MPRACILCGATPPPPLTGEHIWPDWYNRQQPGFRYELESIIQDGVAQVRPVTSLDLKPRVLCNPCNSHWGSDLEQGVERILTPMIRGQPQQLSGRETQLISAWFTLKAMVSEHLIPAGKRPRRFFDLDDGKHLKATLRPPEGTAIWIGRYVGSRANAGWIMDRGTARKVSDSPAAGVFWQAWTYSIGQVLLQLFAATRPIPYPSVGNPEEYGPIPVSFPVAPGDWDVSLARIWESPRLPVAWPPQKAFDDDAFVYLAERWLQEEERS